MQQAMTARVTRSSELGDGELADQRTITLVDVGARGGLDKRWRPFYPSLRVVGFEPDPAECARLNERQWPYQVRFLPIALGARDGEVATLYVCKQPGCSSLLRPNPAICQQFAYGLNLDVVGEFQLTLSRLDTVCDVQPDVLKVDTQGTEIDVLRGAEKLLERTRAVELEVEFVPQYQDQALFADVDAYMRSRGFTLRGLRRTVWRHDAPHTHPMGGQLVHGDALYLRHELLDCAVGHMILAAYRQYDLLSRFGATELIPQRSLGTRFASWLLSGRTNREWRRTIDRYRPPTASDWHDPDFF
jgi:FkbM family methyltransferase